MMLEGIKSFFRKVGIKLKLIKQLESVTEHKKVSLSSEYYDKILEWRELHRGFCEGIHQVEAFSIHKGMHTRNLMSMNMPKVLSQELATLIFNERCSISVSDEKYNEFIQDVFKHDGFNGNFQQYLEFMFAQGGLVIKPYVDNGKVLLGYATADTFLPISWTNNRITEGVFVSSITQQGKYYTHFEWHVKENGVYVVKNELYENETQNTVGHKVPLNKIFENLEEVVTLVGVERPLFAYFKPNLANNIDSTVPLGISVYANAYDTLRMVDTIYDSLHREFKLGKKRIIVPESMIKTIADPETNKIHRYFDPSDETYEAMGGPSSFDDNTIREIKTELRVEEHVAALNAALNILAMQTGFSPGTFSFDAKGGLKTATEVVSENSKTFKTKKSHENVIERSITELIEVIGIVAHGAGLYVPPTKYDVTVTFDDSIAEDQNAEIDKQIKLVAASLQSKVKAIRKIHGLSEEEAIKLMQEIKQEELANAPEFTQVQKSVNFGGQEE